jgi:DNA processing protein
MTKGKLGPIKIIEKKDFPEQLKKIKNSPSKLYYRGNWDNEIFAKSLAIVGSRRMSQYGQLAIKKIVPDLVADGFTIISGFMYGVDMASHRETLECGGKTVAVLGGGLDIISPPENQVVYQEILEKGGLVISEYENDFVPTIWTFPQRDRIVAGLTSLGTLVVEAGLKSGSLITSRFTQEQGKKLFVIPGPINSILSAGIYYLIKEKGAKIVTDGSDITHQKIRGSQMTIEYSDLLEKNISELLEIEALTTDELAKKLNKEISIVSQKMTLMSMENKVSENLGKWRPYK